MSDYNSSLPIRTETAGDVISKICDATVTSQQLGVDSAGKIAVKINDATGAPFSLANPLPVFVSEDFGDEVNDYDTAAALASAGTDNHDYVITALKTLKLEKIHASASGKLKVEVQTSPDGVAFDTVFVGFNSTATPNIDFSGLQISVTGTGSLVRVIRTNLDKSAQDVYSTICGLEV